jgi:hypothetical protein
MGWVDSTSDYNGYPELDKRDSVAIQEGEAVYCLEGRCRLITDGGSEGTMSSWVLVVAIPVPLTKCR